MAGRVARVSTSGSDLCTRLGALLLLGLVQALAQVAGLVAGVTAARQSNAARAATEDTFQVAGNVLAFLQQKTALINKIPRSKIILAQELLTN